MGDHQQQDQHNGRVRSGTDIWGTLESEYKVGLNLKQRHYVQTVVHGFCCIPPSQSSPKSMKRSKMVPNTTSCCCCYMICTNVTLLTCGPWNCAYTMTTINAAGKCTTAKETSLPHHHHLDYQYVRCVDQDQSRLCVLGKSF